MKVKQKYNTNIYTKCHQEAKLFIIVATLLSLCFLVILLCLASVFFWARDNREVEKITKGITKDIETTEIEDSNQTELINPPVDTMSDYWYYIKMNLFEVDFSKLKEKNSDTVAWIKVEGTNINYPVVQTTDNSYYLNHSYRKKENKAGWVFMDYRNNPVEWNSNTIIYAHSRYDSTMFGSLKKILTDKWLKNKDNYIVKFSTPYENTMWQVFSVYSIESESYYITPTFSTIEEYQSFLSTLKSRSIHDFSTELNTNDKIITLSTCQDNYGNRIVLHAKLIKRVKR
ncbi:MAG: class B sortase [Bacilli bacterium]|nr:class B sortase [Bacilli bacterium]